MKRNYLLFSLQRAVNNEYLVVLNSPQSDFEKMRMLKIAQEMHGILWHLGEAVGQTGNANLSNMLGISRPELSQSPRSTVMSHQQPEQRTAFATYTIYHNYQHVHALT